MSKREARVPAPENRQRHIRPRAFPQFWRTNAWNRSKARSALRGPEALVVEPVKRSHYVGKHQRTLQALNDVANVTLDAPGEGALPTNMTWWGRA